MAEILGMSGALFMHSYAPHTGHWIKQSDESRTTASITDDGEMVRPLKPNTTYLIRALNFFTTPGTPIGLVLRLTCSASVDFASLMCHRKIGVNGADFWGTVLNGDHGSTSINTAAFNAGADINASAAGAYRYHGMIRTGSSGGSLSVKWGGNNATAATMKAGSFIYAKEVADSQIVIKQSDESRNTTTTMTDDGELTFPLDAGTTYFIDSNAVFNSGATPAFKLSFVYTGTITSVGLSEAGANAKTVTSTTADALSRCWHLTGSNLTTPTVRTRTGSNTASTFGGHHIRGVIITNTSGNLKIQWAQNVSDGSNTTVHKGSYICVAKGSAIADVFGTLTVKAGDTSRTNNTVTADPDLQFTTKANKKYIAEAFTVHDSNSGTPDSRYQLHDAQCSITAGRCERAGLKATGVFSGGTDPALMGQWSGATHLTTPTQATPTCSVTANKNMFSILWSQTQGGSDSTSAIEWAQNTTNATATIMRAGSWRKSFSEGWATCGNGLTTYSTTTTPHRRGDGGTQWQKQSRYFCCSPSFSHSR
jgi:hypothetical protein